ncbi:MAG: hypothetical protein M3308_08965 [Actinomycetota bacterium]|nr:hypothetical protein [Actinomycetota bacterium]
MDTATVFYQALSGVSFTLLGLWFGVIQFAHGGWRSDPARHRVTLHIALHFFLPGAMALGSLLSGESDGGLLWRVAFVFGGVIGCAEAVTFLRLPPGVPGLTVQTLRLFAPLLYALIVVVAFVPGPVGVLTPLQMEGVLTGLLFLTGLCYVWFAFAERERVGPRP